jgi:MEDS: MEthanogen/methylotroph, DcmR Sensory domain
LIEESVSLQDPSFPQQRTPLFEPKSFGIHRVHFYEPEAFPASSIGDYFCSGIAADESLFFVATQEHTRLVKDHLKTRGVQPDALERVGLLTCLDAELVLMRLRRNGPLSEESLDDVMSSPLKRATNRSPNGRVRVFGEMVNLAAHDGDYVTSMQLERLWDSKAADALRLYCAYSIGCFGDETSSSVLCDVCDLHDEIAPFSPALHPNGYLALLLQRSRALQAEIEKRKAFENASRSWELEYGRLFDAHVIHLRDCIERDVRLQAPNQQLPKVHASLDQIVEHALREILAVCTEALASRRYAPKGSVEWHKRTGEILACGKLTTLFDRLQKFVRRTK